MRRTLFMAVPAVAGLALLAPPAARARQLPQPDRAGGHEHEAEQLGLGEPREHGLVAAQELDEEALGARQDQVPREQHGGPHEVARTPQGPTPIYETISMLLEIVS